MSKPMTEFRTQVASDIARDGLGLELLDSSGDVLAEIFRCDANHTVIVNTFNNDIPIQAMERLLEQARVVLERFEDGTPLPARPTSTSKS